MSTTVVVFSPREAYLWKKNIKGLGKDTLNVFSILNPYHRTSELTKNLIKRLVSAGLLESVPENKGKKTENRFYVVNFSVEISFNGELPQKACKFSRRKTDSSTPVEDIKDPGLKGLVEKKNQLLEKLRDLDTTIEMYKETMGIK